MRPACSLRNWASNPGSRIRVEDAIKALVVKSANDIAATVAENIGKTEHAFAQRMTRTARYLGMTAPGSATPPPAQRATSHHCARHGHAGIAHPAGLSAAYNTSRPASSPIEAAPTIPTTSCWAAIRALTASRPDTPGRPATISPHPYGAETSYHRCRDGRPNRRQTQRLHDFDAQQDDQTHSCAQQEEHRPLLSAHHRATSRRRRSRRCPHHRFPNRNRRQPP